MIEWNPTEIIKFILLIALMLFGVIPWWFLLAYGITALEITFR